MPPRLCSTSCAAARAAVDAGEHARIGRGIDDPVAVGQFVESLAARRSAWTSRTPSRLSSPGSSRCPGGRSCRNRRPRGRFRAAASARARVLPAKPQMPEIRTLIDRYQAGRPLQGKREVDDLRRRFRATPERRRVWLRRRGKPVRQAQPGSCDYRSRISPSLKPTADRCSRPVLRSCPPWLQGEGGRPGEGGLQRRNRLQAGSCRLPGQGLACIFHTGEWPCDAGCVLETRRLRRVFEESTRRGRRVSILLENQY